MDEALEDLRARVRRGDEAARPALLRAVVRAGRPIDLAWEGLPLRLGPGVAALAPDERARVDADLASIDPARVVALVRGLDGLSGVVLVAYPSNRWLVATRAGATGDMIVDATSLPSVHRHLDVSDARGRWHVDWEEVAGTSTGLAAERVLDAARALFRDAGRPFEDPRTERFVPGRAPRGTPWLERTVWTAGVGTVALTTRLRGDGSTEHWVAEVAGLPGGARVFVGGTTSATPKHRVEARRGQAVALEAAWRRALDEVRAST